jgi:hypothetical protein
MLRTITHLEKLAALHRRFLQEGMLTGSMASTYADTATQMNLASAPGDDDTMDIEGGSTNVLQDEELGATSINLECPSDDVGPNAGPQTLSSITLAASPGMFSSTF